jgi:zinc protease
VAPKVASVKYDGVVTALAPEADRQKPPAVAAPVPAALPTPVEKTLANGLRVIVAKSSDLPLITADLTVRGGASADPAGLAGTSSLTADLLTEGTKTRGAVEIARRPKPWAPISRPARPGSPSSLTLSVIADKAPAAMAIMADVAQNPTFKADELDRVRAETLDSLSVAFQRPGGLTGLRHPNRSSMPARPMATWPAARRARCRRSSATTWPRPTPPPGVRTTPSWC